LAIQTRLPLIFLFKIVSIIGVAIIGGALGWIRNLIGIIACVAGAIGSWGCFPLTLLFVVSL
jgi:hypothetical protein